MKRREFITLLGGAASSFDIPSHLGVCNQSARGGQATLYASLNRFQRMYGPEGATFAAYLPFYTPCFTTDIDDADVSDKPIRLFHGAADDYVPVAPCRAYVERVSGFMFRKPYHQVTACVTILCAAAHRCAR
jgi:dienelactone hydrolase